MSTFRYRPASAGGWLAVASRTQLLVVHPDAADAAVSVFVDVGDDSTQGFPATLDELTRGGLSATPPFALLEWHGADRSALRVIVRGGVQAVVMAGGTAHTLDGANVSTWTEESFQQVTGFDVIVVPAPAEVFAEERWLPLERGIALVARITSADRGATDSAAAPAVAQKPLTAKQEAPAAPAVQPIAARRARKDQAPATEPTPARVSESTVADFPAGLRIADPELNPDARPTDAGYDYLFGETMYRNVSEASVRKPDAEAEAVVDRGPGTRDGRSVTTGDLKKRRRSRTQEADAPPAAELYLELSTGSRESLAHPVLVGRAPTAGKVSGGALPRLVTIPGDKDISRSHAQFAVEGGTVVVTDLHSRNGTLVVMPGEAPQQLRQGEPTAVIIGTLVDLGGGVTLTVREGG